MVRLTKDEFLRLHMMPGLVLVQSPLLNEHIRFGSGGLLYIDPSWEPEKHAMRYGEVINWGHNCPGLVVGGTIHFHYLHLEGCSKDGRAFIIEGVEDENGTPKIYFGVKYERCYSCSDKEKTRMSMLNDWVYVSPVLEEIETTLIVPETAKKNKGYEGVILAIDQTNGLKAGDVINFTKMSDVPVEYEDHQTLFGGQKVFRMRKEDIVSILN